MPESCRSFIKEFRYFAPRLTAIGLRKTVYGSHSLRGMKAAMIYRATGNIRAIQILLGHTKIENTVRYLGVDVEDALLLVN